MYWSWSWTKSKRTTGTCPKIASRQDKLCPSAPTVGYPLHVRPLKQFGDVLILIQIQFQSSVFYRLTVRLSVTFVYFVQTAEDIIKLLYCPGSLIILVFLLSVLVPNASAEAKEKGMGKFYDFRLKLLYISETVRDRSIVTVER